MTEQTRLLAIVTGASAGIGYELAKCCVEQGFDVLIAADQSAIHAVTQDFRKLGAAAESIEADLAPLDTEVGQQEKDGPADVARAGVDAMMQGKGDVVTGWKNKLHAAIANVIPAGMLTEQHRKMAEPGSDDK